MKHFNVFIAVLVLTCFAFLPATALAGDELEDFDVTMEVLDDDVDVDEDIAEMRGPEENRDDDVEEEEDEPWFDYEGNEPVAEDDEEDSVDEDRESEGDRREDFEDGDDFEEDREFEEEGDVDESDDFEEGEEIDDDEYDEPEEPEDDMEDDLGEDV